MKKYILSVIIIITALQFSNGQTTAQGKIVIFREKGSKAINTVHEIYMNDSLIVTLTNNSSYDVTCKAGTYELRVNEFKYTILNVDVKSDETIYIRLSLQRISGVDIPSLTQVDGNTAFMYMGTSTQPSTVSAHSRDRGALRELSTKRRRVGIGLNFGVGFANVPIASSNTGITSSISFGGGYAINLKYGQTYNDRFDLAFDLSYQASQLTPALNDADVTFSRGIISVTPSYIFPLGHKRQSLLKVGAGGASYFNSSLKIETSKIQGIDDKWIYKNAYGAHISVIYELRMSERISMNFGLKGYYVGYSFSKGQQYVPIDKKLSSPDGSGIDIQTGVNYHF